MGIMMHWKRKEKPDERQHPQKALALEPHTSRCIRKHSGEYDNEYYDCYSHLYAVHEICRQVEGIPCLDVVFVVQHCRRAEGVRREYLQVVLEGIEQHPNERIQVHDRVDVEKDLEKQRADR